MDDGGGVRDERARRRPGVAPRRLRDERAHLRASARSAVQHSDWVRARTDARAGDPAASTADGRSPVARRPGTGRARAARRLGLSEHDAASAVLAEAEELLAEGLDLGTLRRPGRGRLRRELSKGGRPDDGREHLTPAELRLLPLLTTHLSFREIAEILHISRNTVKTQAICVYRKLGVSSRSAAIERASELGPGREARGARALEGEPLNETRTDRTTTGAAARVTVRGPMGTPIRIIVGEPDYLAREGLVRALEAAEGLDVVSICSTMTSLGVRGPARASGRRADAAGLPAEPSQVTRSTSSTTSRPPSRTTGVVVTGDHSDLVHALPLFDSGIARRAFIVRSRIRNASQLTRAIREVASGNSLVDPAAVGTLLNAARQRRRLPVRVAHRARAGGAEHDRGAESNNAIARDLHITTRAVERHVNSIFRKLGLSGSRDVNRRVQAALAFSATMQAEPNGKAVHPVRARH